MIKLCIAGHRSKAVRLYKRTAAGKQNEASNILYGLRSSNESKKAKPSAAGGAQVDSVSVEWSTDESDKKMWLTIFRFDKIHVK